MDIKKTIKDYLVSEFGEGKSPGKHFSYCQFPGEDCSCVHLDEIEDDTALISGGYIDSFSMVVVLVFLEKTFDIKISDMDAAPSNFDSLNNMLKLVQKYKSILE